MTTAKSLYTLHNEHQGKLSDKWELYLDVYDRSFQHLRSKEISLLEIGVQNGGSLEVWGKYFPNAQAIIGCDIDPKCAKLEYADDRINVVVSDANTAQAYDAITKRTERFDIVIDDGSHRSSDIIATFARYFPLLKPGGIYVAEDLHCSYWPAYEGGLFAKTSAMSFFKALVDLVNVDHWGAGRTLEHVGAQKRNTSVQELLGAFFPKRAFPQWLENHTISSVEAYDSLVLVRRASATAQLRLGKRCIVGNEATVNPAPLNFKES
jgi:hypothetical protein